MGKPAARITDMHVCPMVTPGTPPIPHVGGPVVMGSPNVLTGKLPQARVGDMAVCVGPPDVIAMGSTGVFVNKRPAARIGDQTAHGGTIVAGLPTVLIGETKAGGGGGAGPMFAGATMLQFAEYAAQVQVLISAFQAGAPFAEICFKNALAKLKAPTPAPALAPAAKAPAANPPPATPASLPPSHATPKQNAIVCEVVSHKIKCEHGREPGPTNVLMVVPDRIHDRIVGSIAMKGGCGHHPVWVVSGAGSKSGKADSYDFEVSKFPHAAIWPRDLRNASPKIYDFSATSCDAGAARYAVHAYPSGEVSWKLNFEDINRWIVGFLDLIPLPPEVKDDWIPGKKILVGELKYAGAWKEEKPGWRAYCESSFTMAFSPLIGVEAKGPVWPPVKVPSFLQKYFKAGLFLTLGAGGDVSYAHTSNYFPDPGKDEVKKHTVSGGVSGTVKLSLELTLVSSEVVEGEISGSTGLGVKLIGEHGDGTSIKLEPKWDGIKATATVKLAWGFVEFSRDFQLMGEATYDKLTFNFGDSEKVP